MLNPVNNMPVMGFLCVGLKGGGGCMFAYCFCRINLDCVYLYFFTKRDISICDSNISHCIIFTMVSYFLRWTLLNFFSSIPDEQSQQKVRRLGRITRAVINTSNEVKCPLLWEFRINNFSLRILERVLVGNIVNIRNECLFFWVHGVWIVARNKQINREPLRGSRDIAVISQLYI